MNRRDFLVRAVPMVVATPMAPQVPMAGPATSATEPSARYVEIDTEDKEVRVWP